MGRRCVRGVNEGRSSVIREGERKERVVLEGKRSVKGEEEC